MTSEAKLNLDSVDGIVNPKNVGALRSAIERGEATGDFLPAVYVVEPVSECNLRCIMCPNHLLKASDIGHAKLSDLEVVFEAIAPTAELTMLYFMGEPTLHAQLPAILESARSSLQGRIVVSTNGQNVPDTQIGALLRNADIVIVPIDRWDSEQYSKIRRGGEFSQVVQFAEKLLDCRGGQASPQVLVKMLDLNINSASREVWNAESAAFREYWSSRGALPLAGWLDSWAGQLPNLLRLTAAGSPYSQSARTSCADLWFKMVVNWRGEVVLCCHNFDYSVKLGTGIASSFDIGRIWQSASLVRYRESQMQGNFANPGICASCREWGEPGELDAYLGRGLEDYYRVF